MERDWWAGEEWPRQFHFGFISSGLTPNQATGAETLQPKQGFNMWAGLSHVSNQSHHI